MKKSWLFFFIIFVFIVSFSCVLGLPNQNTQETGNLCSRAHFISYDYNFVYDKELELNKSYPLAIDFNIQGSQVSRSVKNIQLEIIPDGFEISSRIVSLNSGSAMITIKPLKENSSLSIVTELVLEDNTVHNNYQANYIDNFLLNDFNTKNRQNISNLNNSVVDNSQNNITKTVNNSGNNTQVNFHVDRTEYSKVPWYLVRITGIIAYILLALSVLIALLRKFNINFLTKFHCDISYFALTFAFLHAIDNLWDKFYWELGFKQVFWFNFSWKLPLFISFGVLGLYLMTLVTFSSVSPKTIGFLKYKNWKFLHISSYVAYVFVVVHSLILGTDVGLASKFSVLGLISTTVFWIFLGINLLLFLLMIFRRKK